MPKLFEKTAIKSLELRNRSVRSATWSGVGDREGFVTDRGVEFYRELAAGGMGLIVTGFQYVMPNGVAMRYQVGNYDDAQIEGLRRLCDAVHSEDCRVVAQIAHTGAKANPDLFPKEGDVWGPSAVTDPLSGRTPKEMSPGEISQLVQAYAAAAERSKKAGFDGVQLHGAHGYGINQFLSGAANRRGDRYGGDIRSRYRFLGEVLEAVRAVVGKDFPVLIKLSGNDFAQGGLTPEESLYVGRRLSAEGIDAIEVSGGSRASENGMIPSRLKIRRQEDEAYLADLAARFKEMVSVPIITVGGIRSPKVISRILDEGKADYAAMCRPFIREPHLIRRWEAGDLKKATCISCNQCFDAALEGNGVYCKVDKKLKEKKRP
ncbi:MAG: NADH:flavin oxidoreductase [Deltaproteobacteria bacterium]|nr:NADH:flavin oxidoreductase [Deltaproteobacteria bacterium]